MTKTVRKEAQRAKVNKKLATVALAGMLAVGTFSASPAFAGSGGNACSASGCGSKTEGNACKSGCKSSDKPTGGSSCASKTSCQTKSSCQAAATETKATCQAKASCENKASCSGHNDKKRYND
ncbi:MAG: hypothetical protein IPH06_08540 [Alphaproteobacteria bacterium]|jgi:hypothetical protein|nr:hypothetical protein [Alphaproteobacteria bacterium]QQS58047.1 MAG: hypothetical protein IPN28_04300 [Alphaproteobacteria bacterium]